MGEGKKRPEKVTSVEFKVSMHCKACERSVIKALSKVKGVETILSDKKNHRVIATGRIEPEKALKKLKKKMGKKRVEIVADDDDDDGRKDDVLDMTGDHDGRKDDVLDNFNCCIDTTTFSDENPNACYVM